jgi:hypothetical protein
VTTVRFQPSGAPFPAAKPNVKLSAHRTSSSSQSAPDLSAEARYKFFDNKFFLKYIQQLGLRKISHFHSR